jgi:hypothetical protein
MSDRMSDAEFEHLQDQISYGDIKELQWLVDEARRAREGEEVYEAQCAALIVYAGRLAAELDKK